MSDSIYDLLKIHQVDEHLAKINSILQDSVKDNTKLGALVRYLIKAQSKRLRPLLMLAVILKSKAELSESDYLALAAVEMLHISTLVHDDIIDQSSYRHSETTINFKYNDEIAIVAGDYLINKSFELAFLANPQNIPFMTQAFNRICEGQYSELQSNFKVDRSVNEYLQSITGKTAYLFGYALKIAANQLHYGDQETEKLFEYGINFGIVFQIVDDLIDIFATQELAQKKVHQDFKEGIYTLPILLARDINIIELKPDQNFTKLKNILLNNDVFNLCEVYLKPFIEKSNLLKYNQTNLSEEYYKWAKKKYFWNISN